MKNDFTLSPYSADKIHPMRWWSLFQWCRGALIYLGTHGLKDCLYAVLMRSGHVSLWPQGGDKAPLLLSVSAAERA